MVFWAAANYITAVLTSCNASRILLLWSYFLSIERSLCFNHFSISPLCSIIGKQICFIKRSFYSPAAVNRLRKASAVCSIRVPGEMPLVLVVFMGYKRPMQTLCNGLLSFFSNTLKIVSGEWEALSRGGGWRTACLKIVKAGRLSI